VMALDLVLRADQKVKELSLIKANFFEGISNIDVAFLNLFWFYNHYNSITLRDPLNLAFDEIYQELKEIEMTVFSSDKISRLYQLFCIAATLDTGRNSDPKKFLMLFEEQDILTNPFFVFLFEEGSNMLELKNRIKLKTEKKTQGKMRKYREAIRFYLNTPSQELRFTKFDQLVPIKNFHIFTEGKTDATIISHAFSIISSNVEPYWNISSMDKVKGESGGAHELKKHLEELSKAILIESDSKKFVLGIFDNDAKGIQEFNGISKEFGLLNENVKKHDKHNIFALKLPIPNDDDRFVSYRQTKQEFNFFEIEHYFPMELLEEHNMVTETSIPGVFEITGGKTKFSEDILNEDNEVVFREFSFLFSLIDEVFGKSLNYID
jgi:hypothetical protein